MSPSNGDHAQLPAALPIGKLVSAAFLATLVISTLLGLAQEGLQLLGGWGVENFLGWVKENETIGWVRQTGPGARTLLKRDLNRQLPPIDLPMFAESLASDEVKEGFQAFVEKRPPAWIAKRG